MTFPAELDVSGRDITVVGGSAEALGRISSLVQAGARVTVVSPQVATSIRDLAERGLLTWLPRNAEGADFRRSALVIAATGSVHTDHEVRVAAGLENRITVSVRSGAQESGLGAAGSSPGQGHGWAEGAPPSAAQAHRAAGEAHAPAVTTTPAESRSAQQPPPAEPGAAASCAPGQRAPRSAEVGTVVLVGGGPGDPGLLTVAGLEALRSADVIISDRLAPLAALQEARPGAEIVDVGKIPRGEFTPQERINSLLVEHARVGRRVVRLKGGDNFIFGRGGEEWQACAAAGIAVEVIPGVSSAIAAPALAGIPLTHRQLTQGFTVVSGHLPPGHAGSTLDWAALARTNTTLVILMGVATLRAIADELIGQGLAPDTPAVTIADAGLASQRVVRGEVATVAHLTEQAGLHAPAITIIGAVAGFDPFVL